jgi:hypothetical protein
MIMPDLVSMLEVALLMILPLILFWRRSDLPKRQQITGIAALYAIWFLSYAPLHEAFHLLGSWLTGTRIAGYRLVPPFWKGDFSTAFVDSRFENATQAVVSVLMPYLRDIVLLLLSLWAVKRERIGSQFLKGLILVLGILSPLFDIINNYSGYIFQARGDFRELSKWIGSGYSHLAGALLTAMALFTAARIYLTYRDRHDLLKTAKKGDEPWMTATRPRNSCSRS